MELVVVAQANEKIYKEGRGKTVKPVAIVEPAVTVLVQINFPCRNKWNEKPARWTFVRGRIHWCITVHFFVLSR